MDLGNDETQDSVGKAERAPQKGTVSYLSPTTPEKKVL